MPSPCTREPRPELQAHLVAEDMAEALGMDVPTGLSESQPVDEALPFESITPPPGVSKEQIH